jgi:Fe-S-cluster containining protein
VAQPLEVFALADYLRHHLQQDALEQLVARLAEREEIAVATDDETLVKANRACVLLKDGLCSAYAARPLVCRAWHSFSRESCEKAFSGDPTTSGTPVEAIPFILKDIGRIAAETALRGRNVNMDCYDLQSALLRVLTANRPVERWLVGEDIFAGCRHGIKMPGQNEESIKAEHDAVRVQLGL